MARTRHSMMQKLIKDENIGMMIMIFVNKSLSAENVYKIQSVDGEGYGDGHDNNQRDDWHDHQEKNDADHHEKFIAVPASGYIASSYILKAKSLRSLLFSPKKNLRKKCVNLDIKISRQKCANQSKV